MFDVMRESRTLADKNSSLLMKKLINTIVT